MVIGLQSHLHATEQNAIQQANAIGQELQTMQQQYFAETFPDNVTFNDGTSIKAFLRRVSGLDRIQRQ